MERWTNWRRSVRLATVESALVVAGGLLAAGCVDVKGGAVEVPWAIFDSNGRRINDCPCAVDPATIGNPAGEKSIAFVQLNLVSSTGDQPCAGIASCRFACSRMIGATPFMIPKGLYQMSLTPLAADGSELPIPSTPAESRDVVSGRPTELGAFSFTAGCASTCNGGSVTQPCAGG